MNAILRRVAGEETKIIDDTVRLAMVGENRENRSLGPFAKRRENHGLTQLVEADESRPFRRKCGAGAEPMFQSVRRGIRRWG